MSVQARPDRLTWRIGRRGNLLPTAAYELPPLKHFSAYFPDRVTTDLPSQRMMPLLNITLPHVSIVQASTAYLDEALRARAFG